MLKHNLNRIINSDCLTALKLMPDDSIDCVVTSPPYWKLRDYQTNPVIWNAKEGCKHHWKNNFCTLCNAWQGELGAEPNYHLYINHLCDIFDEIQRVIKSTGTCWVNLGDIYNPKNKSLMLIPSKFSVEMLKRGWVLRNIIIWQKPNTMPHSVKDRFTVDFEYLFFFVKSPKYYFEQQFEPIKESTIKKAKSKINENKSIFYQGMSKENYEKYQQRVLYDPAYKGRNKRTVWNIATVPFKGAHIATYPPKLIEIPIKAGCPENGIVLDPFMGSGTTAVVAKKLNRNYIGIELNPEYIKMAEGRIMDAS